jgi:hypothetical protein
MKSAVRVQLLAVSVACVGGCQSSTISEPFEPFELLELRPGTSPVTAAMMYPLKTGDREVEVIERDGTWTMVARREPTDRYQAQWVNIEGEERRHFWTVTEEGDLAMTAVIEHGENALTVFDPPLTIAPASLAPGESVTATARMRVLGTESRRQRESGTVTQKITYSGDQVVRTTLGRHVARRVTIEFQADLRLADVADNTVLLVVPELGAVIEFRAQNLIVLGVMPRRTERTLVLTRPHDP